jgi:ATP-dependent DNA ligase
LREHAPHGPDWLHEIKIDGYRAQVHVHDGRVRVYSRSGYDWTVQCILQTRDGRLRRQRCPAYRTAADRNLHQRIVPQPVEVDGILIAARDRRRARHHHLEHRVPDAFRIAPIRQAAGPFRIHPERGLTVQSDHVRCCGLFHRRGLCSSLA